MCSFFLFGRSVFVLTWPPGKLHARDGSVGWQSRRNYAQRHDLFLETFRERDQKLGNCSPVDSGNTLQPHFSVEISEDESRDFFLAYAVWYPETAQKQWP